MTACNLIVRPEAAYLISDTSTYDVNGAVVGFTSKVVPAPRLRMAIARTGVQTSKTAAIIAGWLSRQPDQASALRDLPALLETIAADCKDGRDADPATADQWKRSIGLVVAAYSTEDDRTAGYVIATDAELHRSLEPMKVRQTQQFISPNVLKTYLGAWPFDPRSDACDLLACQRQTQHFKDRRSIIGGAGEVAQVSAAGVAVDTICHWPDRVGAMIDPRAPLIDGPPPAEPFSLRGWISGRLGRQLPLG